MSCTVSHSLKNSSILRAIQKSSPVYVDADLDMQSFISQMEDVLQRWT